MTTKLLAFGLLLFTMCPSCKSNEEQPASEKVETKKTSSSKEVEVQPSTVDTSSIIRSLQGEWKEPEYPFRVAQFKNTTVKFIEEGVVEEPRFQEYKISTKCGFDVNNIKNARPNDIFLVMMESGTCDIIKVANDTLVLSGYSTNTREDYKIIYTRVK